MTRIACCHPHNFGAGLVASFVALISLARAPRCPHVLLLAVILSLGFASISFGLGGPVIIGGDDADDHGSFSGTNQNGWLYIESVFDGMGPSVENGNKVAVCLGCNGSLASGGFESGFDQSNLPGAGWTRVTLTTAPELTGFFDGSGATNVNNSGIIYMPTDAINVFGGITSAQLTIVNANANGIKTFVSSGGGLFAHDESLSPPEGFAWLATLLPGLVVHGLFAANLDQCNDVALNLTPEGQSQFPQLSDAVLSSATPWHSWFSGNFGALSILATGSCAAGAQAVILGGRQVTVPVELSNFSID